MKRLYGTPWTPILCALVLWLGGCGGTSRAKAVSADRARAEEVVPAFRVGQYCQLARVFSYRAAGFVCVRHHLKRP